ncbi:CBS domain-containing protein [Marinicellulosiphila megalodicopiae]|uniref:CBS domain-containing protein n=1 Tax=Marinicellulosiphila megalodicopiae TaxID=2724896 RepID=UPI003BAE6070
MQNDTISSIMNTKFASIPSSMLVVEASKELIKSEALGGVVLDDDGKLQGWISEQDCLQVIIQVAYHNQRVAGVSDIMKTDVLSVSPDQTILSIAEKMSGPQPKNYPVVDQNGNVVGIVTRREVIKYLLAHTK